jgi:hypothetical protein
MSFTFPGCREERMTGVERALLRECPLEPMESEKARLWLRNEAWETERVEGV